MKKILLSTVALAATFAVATATPLESADKPTLSTSTQVVNSRMITDKKVKQLAPGVTLTTDHGVKRLHNLYNDRTTSIAKPVHKTLARAAEAPEGYVLFESFEVSDFEDSEWIPEGWTLKQDGKIGRDQSWGWIPGDGFYLPAAPDGNFYFAIYDDANKKQDEWLISPYVEVADKMELTYWAWLLPAYLYVVDSQHVDFYGTRDFIGDREISANLQIYAQAEGDENWVLLRDYAEEYKDIPYYELEKIQFNGLEKTEVGLEEFFGKKTRVAFRYVGIDGGIVLLDAVGIGYPCIENISFISPYDMQFWGPQRSPELWSIERAVALYPANEPITWYNMDVDPDLSYTWSYYDPDTDELVTTTEDPYELTLTYEPKFISDETPDLNLFGSPSLRADAPERTPDVFEAPYSAIQAGGKPGLKIEMDTETIEYEPCILPFNPQLQGMDMLLINDSQVHDAWLPVFGYNVNTDQYWLNYSLNGNEELPGDYSHLIGVGNLLWPSFESPMVVTGVTMYAYAQFYPDAEFKATIYGMPMTEDGVSGEYESLIPLASKTILGSDVLREEASSKCYMCLPFDFDEPVVIQATEEVPAFMVVVEGFNSDKVDSFAPLQSQFDDPDGYTKGYIINHIDISAHTGMPAYYSIKPMQYSDNGKYIDVYGAFAIGLNGSYPWLTTECEGVKLTEDNPTAEVSLNSYYDGSELTIEAPQGVIATAEGRNRNCVLKVSMGSNAVSTAGNIVVKGLGVEVTIPVDVTAGITEISADDAAIAAIYDVAGRKVGSAPTPGIYVAKLTDGTTRKLVVK